ncbi:MAG: hypothetical protein ACI89L_002514 [Phycisphaerales bacterium]|jgi:hypothetical protein
MHHAEGRRVPNARITLPIAAATLAAVPLSFMLGLVTYPDDPAKPAASPTPSNSAVTAERPISFNRDIRPLLADRCFVCHGPDAKLAKEPGGLRLDSFEGATAIRADGVTPIVPGDANASELVRRVRTADPDDRMPPPQSHLSLSADEIVLLERWIESGAAYDTHWAFKLPVKPEMPADPSGGGGEDGWSVNEIDRFILDRLTRAGTEPSARADRENLIRRVTLDLTGLPPTPEETDAFLADTEPGAYERVVDRLLASPHYGERVATMWLDVARYADTLGFHHDNKSSQWPWRDWVIDAFNTNMPFDTFLTEQLAGDLLPDATMSQRVATAYNRNHSMTDEGGAIDAEYLVEYAADRVSTTSTAMLGLTMQCARCHDHKYDPLSQTDYFSLFAFFNSVEEKGLFDRAQGDRDGAFAPFLAAPSEVQTVQLDAMQREIDAAQTAAEQPIEGLDDEFATWETTLAESAGLTWAESLVVKAESTSESTLTLLEDGSVLAGGPDPDQDVYEITLHTDATRLDLVRLDALTDPSLPMGLAARASHGNAVLSEIEALATSTTDMSQTQTVRFDFAWASHEQQNGDFGILRAIDGDPGTGWAPAGHQLGGGRIAMFRAAEPFGFAGGTELTIRLRFESPYTKHSLGRVRLAVASTSQTDSQTASGGALGAFPVIWREWFTAGPFTAGSANDTFTKYFGPEGVNRVRTEDRFDSKAWSHNPEIKDGEVYGFSGDNSATYFGRQIITPVARSVPVSLGSDDAIRVWLNGEPLLSNNTRRGAAADQETLTLNLRAGENTLVCKVVNDQGPAGFYFRADEPDDWPRPIEPVALVPQSEREPGEATRLAEMFKRERSPEYKARQEAIELAQAARAEALKAVPNVMVMQELPEPRPTHVLNRGSYDQPIEDRPVTRRPPSVLGSLPDGAPANRLGLAQWMTSDENPMVARVAANRFWHMLFGTGIVKTLEDFGTQGEWPSHPDLLDWLAVDFREHGWDVKRLVRQIVTSSTYTQSSDARPELAEIDASNRLLAHFPRQRLPAENIRDQALAASGLLNDLIGGASVRPYQPTGLWIERSMPSSNTKNFMPSAGSDLYRRGMYTFWKRSSPPPQMVTFDAPGREYCVVRRGVTNTPLQALMLLNDVTYLEIARAMAQRVILESRDDRFDQLDGPDAVSWQISRAFRLLTGRVPTVNEVLKLESLHRGLLAEYEGDTDAAMQLLSYGESPRDESIEPPTHAAMAMVASVILNLDETVTRN